MPASLNTVAGDASARYQATKFGKLAGVHALALTPPPTPV